MAAEQTQVEYPEELKEQARGFFSRGAEVAYTLNYDYAVELYLDGLSFWPDALNEGHKPLREIALRRQAAGGKKSGFGDSSKFKKGSGKNAKDAVLKAEYLLSKDPANTGHMTDMVKASLQGGYRDTSLWMANILFDSNRRKDKPSAQTYVFLRDAYKQLDDFARALQACQQAAQLKPNDVDLAEAMRDLSAQATMQQGKYDSDGDFRDSIRDREQQERLHAQDLLIRSEESSADIVEQARAEYEAAPTVPGKINKLVDVLCQGEDPRQETEAIAVLEKAYTQTKNFRFKQRCGTIKIKQANRRVRQLQRKLKKDPGNAALKKQLQQGAREVLRAELEHYKLCVANYPTDLGLRFEYGKRLMRGRLYDDAIPCFQEARSDPRHRIASLNYIGQCFFHKKWYPDAIETFQQALELVESGENALAKELRYNLGRAFEAAGKTEDALNCFRKVAQIDFNYLDVRKRIDALREQPGGSV